MEHLHPGAVGAGTVMLDPGHLLRQEYPFRVRHHDGKAPVGAGEPGRFLGRPVRVIRIGLSHRAAVIHEAHGCRGLLPGSVEYRPAFPVGHHDGQSRSGHAPEEQGARVGDLDHHHPGFELLGAVALEIRPVVGAGYDTAQPGQHLAAVADPQAEAVGAVEEAFELVPETVVVEDGLCPAAAGAQDVAVGKTAAGYQAGQVGQ